jgi:hypothetical protein
MSGGTPCCAQVSTHPDKDAKWTKERVQQFNAWLERKGCKRRRLSDARNGNLALFFPDQTYRVIRSTASGRMLAEELHKLIRDNLVFAWLQHERVHA